MKAECKDCASEINIAHDAVIGEIVTCADCGADFELVFKNGNSAEIKAAETVGEDWGQ